MICHIVGQNTTAKILRGLLAHSDSVVVSAKPISARTKNPYGTHYQVTVAEVDGPLRLDSIDSPLERNIHARISDSLEQYGISMDMAVKHIGGVQSDREMMVEVPAGDVHLSEAVAHGIYAGLLQTLGLHKDESPDRRFPRWSVILFWLMLLLIGFGTGKVFGQQTLPTGSQQVFKFDLTRVGGVAVSGSLYDTGNFALRINCVVGCTSASPTYGAAFPATGTAVGFSDGTNMQGARVFDLDSGVGSQYGLGLNLRKIASGGSVEAGTSTDPLRVDPTGSTAQPASQSGAWNVGQSGAPWTQRIQDGAGTNLATVTAANAVKVDGSAVTQPVSGTVTANAGSGTFTITGALTDAQLRATPVPVTGGGGGTEYTEDVATPPDPIGATLSVRRRDTLATETTTDGDWTTANSTAKGEIYVKHVDSIPVTGTFWQSTQPVSAASLPLPTGAATETTLGTRLADATFTGRINTQGQKAMSASTPVVIASDQSGVSVDFLNSSTSNTPAQTAVGTTSVQLIAANSSRKQLIVQNTGTTVIKVTFSATAPTQTVYHVALKAGSAADDGLGGSVVTDLWTGAVQAISSAAGGTVVITEIQ